jgi:hypothetical protein
MSVRRELLQLRSFGSSWIPHSTRQLTVLPPQLLLTM